MRQQGFDIAQNLARLFQLTPRQTRFTHQEVQCALGIHQTQADLPANIFQFRQRRKRFVIFITLTPFHDHTAEFFQVAVDIFDLIRQLFNFSFEQVEQQLVSVAIHHRLITRTHAVQAKCRQLALAQSKQATFANGKCDG